MRENGRNLYRKQKNYIIRCRKIRKFRKKRNKKYFCRIEINTYKQKLKETTNVLNFLRKEKFYNLNKTTETEITVEIPRIFSIIENPNTVLETLKYILSFKETSVKTINFIYKNVQKLDIGAVLLKNVICLNLMNTGMAFKGDFPGAECNRENLKEYKEAIEIFLFSGLFKALNFTKKEHYDKLKPIYLPLMGGGKDTPSVSCKPINLGEIEKKITDFFNKALRQTVKKELTLHGARFFDKIIGEVITNCKEHTGDFNQYYCLGHCTKTDEGIAKFQLSIFDFGQTIYQGLKNSDKLPKETQNKINDLVRLHTKKSFFKTSKWDEESLYTLYSLQNGVSRMYDKNKTRGTGTIKLIQTFQKLGDSINKELNPKMTIISGQTQILFDNSDLSKLNNKKISFNKSKDLNFPPDENYVKKLDNFFPGTIISLSVYLDETYLNSITR